MFSKNKPFIRFWYVIPLAVCFLGLTACHMTLAPEISSLPETVHTSGEPDYSSPPGETSIPGETDLTAETDLTGETLSESASSGALSIERTDITSVGDSVSKADKRRVAYFTSWSAYARGLEISDMDPSLLTHINFAFANLNQNGEICVGDSWVDTEKPFSGDSWDDNGSVRGHFGQLQKLKQSNPGIQILISVGGWTWSGNFSATAATNEGRKTFADSAVTFLTQYGFDGLDIDWEFPVEGGNGIEHRPEDRENYTLLLKEVRGALDRLGEQNNRHYLLTIAGGPNPSFTANTQISEIMAYVDFINVMAYDYHGSWESFTGHNAPLYASDGLSVSDTITAYIAAGARPEKLNLGLAFYGRGWVNAAGSAGGTGRPASAPSGAGYGLGTWEGSVFDYWDLDQNYVGQNGYTRYYDSAAKVPYLYNGSVFISYDDPESIGEKLSYAARQGLGGVMFWDFSGDKQKKLQRLIYDYDHGGNLPAPAKENAPAGTDFVPNDSGAGLVKDGSGAGQAPAWNPETIYNSGDLAQSGGVLYQAKWWTQNQEPSANCQDWGPWKVLGE